MDEVKDPLAPKTAAGPVCRHLRCKGHYVEPDEHEQKVEWYDATTWWCAETQKALGPDFKPVHSRWCTSKRPCFRFGEDPS